MLLLAKKIKD